MGSGGGVGVESRGGEWGGEWGLGGGLVGSGGGEWGWGVGSIRVSGCQTEPLALPLSSRSPQTLESVRKGLNDPQGLVES